MTGDEASAYDDLPYPSLVHAFTHPAQHAALAGLLGLPMRDIERGRVLEVGCGDGANLIAMAESLPGAAFLGIDYAANHIAAARKQAEALGLGNVRFEQADIREFPASEGEFDSIIAHGVYSWVAPAVQDALLALCARHLAPDGIAHISYAVYPGRHAAEGIRQAMLYRAQKAPTTRERVRMARQMLAFLTTFEPDPEDPLAKYRSAYAARVDEIEDSLLLHDDIGEINQPVYFWQFAKHLERHGLAYLAETEFAHVMPERYGIEAGEVLYEMADDIVELEQYIDFLTNRSFRRSLVCRGGDVLQRSLEPDPERFRRLFIASRNKPVDAPESGLPQQFRNAAGIVFPVSDPLSSAAMLCLGEAFPRAFSFDELLAAARARLVRQGAVPGGAAEDAAALANTLLLGFSLADLLITLWAARPPVAAAISEYPYVRPLARYLASRGERTVTNLWHVPVALDPTAFDILPLLDGTNSRETLLAALREMRPKEDEAIVAADLAAALEALYEAALLAEQA